MKSVTVSLDSEERAILKNIMLDQNERKPSTAVRRALEDFFGYLVDVETTRIVCVGINEAIDAEIRRRGWTYVEAVRKALSAYAVDGVEIT